MFKKISDSANTWLAKRAIKTGLSGKGPAIVYQCRGCGKKFIEIDILNEKTGGGCPNCGGHKWNDQPHLSNWDYILFTIRILSGK
jgi:DNA-directed RNA polymerase subunit RPC12/RpoP